MKKKMPIKSVILIVLAVVMLVGAIGYLSRGFEQMNPVSWVYERNPENLMTYPLDVEQKADGITTKVDSNGVISIKGFARDKGGDFSYGYFLGSPITLPAGTYTLSTADCNSTRNGVQLIGYIQGQDSTVQWYADSDIDIVDNGKTVGLKKTQTFTKDTTVTFQVVIRDGADENVNYTIKPILNTGDKPIDFYVSRSLGNK